MERKPSATPSCSTLPIIGRVVLASVLLLGVAPASVGNSREAAPWEAAPWIGTSLNDTACRGGRANYGPYDYTNPEAFNEKLPIVNAVHFTPWVESLKGGNTAATPLPDINYTLLQFPNHHRALFALIRYYLKLEPWKPGHHQWDTPPECYLQRAIAFSPKDAAVHTLYGVYLHRRSHLQQAVEQYREALALAPDSAEAHYNLGLALLDLKRYKEAQAAARKAYALGYPLPGLRERLTAAGYAP